MSDSNLLALLGVAGLGALSGIGFYFLEKRQCNGSKDCSLGNLVGMTVAGTSFLSGLGESGDYVKHTDHSIVLPLSALFSAGYISYRLARWSKI